MMLLNQMQVASIWDKFGADFLFDILASVVSVPSLAGLVGLGLVIAGIVGILKTRRFLATAVSAPGVVTKNIVEEVPSSDCSCGGPYL